MNRTGCTILALLLPGSLGWSLTQAWSQKYSVAQAWELFQAAKETGTDLPWQASVALGLPVASVIATVIALIGLLTLRWWGDLGGAGHSGAEVPRSRSGRILIFAAVLTALCLRLPLATGSMWWDELWNVRNATVGEWKPSKMPDTFQFKETTWERALYFYNKPTNHAIQTLPSKLCHTAYTSLTGAPEGRFSELVLRLPVLGAGLLAILLCARMASRWGGVSAGVLTAWLMALHPWLLRYGVDARSYGITVLLVPLTIHSAWHAIAPRGGGTMAWWWALGLCLALLMWAHPLAHFLPCAGLVTVCIVFLHRHQGGDAGHLIRRLLMICLVASGLFLVLFLPCLLQSLRWQGRNADDNLLTTRYLQETLMHAAFGRDATGLIAGVGLGVVGLLLVLGWQRLPRRQAITGLIAATSCGTLIYMALSAFGGLFFFHRFAISLAPVLCILVALGCGHHLSGWRTLPVAGLTLWLWWPAWRTLTTASISPMREAAHYMDTQRRLAGSGTIACYGLGANMLQSYAPPLVDIRDKDGLAQLRALITNAQSQRRPLWVAWAYDGFMSTHYPDGLAVLKDPSLFTVVQTFPGVEPDFAFQIVKLRDPAPSPP